MSYLVRHMLRPCLKVQGEMTSTYTVGLLNLRTPPQIEYNYNSNIVGKSTLPLLSNLMTVMNFHTSATVERARQSTRLRKRKVILDNKKKKEERLRKNPPPIPKKIKLMLRAKGLGDGENEWRQEDEKPFPEDDVWDEQWHTWKRMSLSECLTCLREHYHPSMLDSPNGIVNVRLEFNMNTGKKDRYMDNFNKMVPLLHGFERGVSEKSILVFAASEEARNAALEAGASKVGGSDLIEDIVKGKVDVVDYDHFIAHDDILTELKPLLGILRDQFPKKNLGTVGSDMDKLVKTFSNGQLIEVKKKPASTLGYKDDPSFGECEAMIGRLEMPDEHILTNLTSLLENLEEAVPKKGKATGFVTRAQLFLDDRLKKKLDIHHERVHDKKLKDHVKAAEKKAQAAA